MARVKVKYYRIEHSVWFGDGSSNSVEVISPYVIREYLINTYLKCPTLEPDYYKDISLETLIGMVESIEEFEDMEVSIKIEEHTLITEGKLLDE